MPTETVTFETTLSAFGNNTGIEVPPELIERLGAGKRPAVVVDLNGHQYCNTIGVMGGKYLISVSAAIRKETGLAGGDPVQVCLTLADGPRPVAVPDDLRAALDANPVAREFFGGLSNSLQRYHVDNLNAAKTDATRERRLNKALGLFLAGKPR